MTKKIVVPVAGRATRMQGAAGDNPKHLININGRPFLYYSCKNFLDAGFEEIILVVGHKKEKIEEFAREYKNIFPITIVDQFREVGTEKYGSACPIEAVEKMVGPEEFVMVNGDDFFAVDDLGALRELDDGYNYIGGYRHPEPHHFGILIFDKNNRLKKIHEKPTPDVDFDSTRPFDYLVSPGMYHFQPEIFAAVKRVTKSPRGEYEITDAITDLARQKKVKVRPVENYWHTLSRPEDIAKMEEVMRGLS